MKSQVLCVTRDALIEIGLPPLNQSHGIYNIHPKDIPWNEYHFINRKVCDCEGKVNPDFLKIGKLLPQILGYVTIIDENKKVLTYSRGKGAEVRLKKRSIGFGGHVDNTRFDVSYDSCGNPDYYQTLINSIDREIKEEIGLILNHKNTRMFGLISDETSDEVGQVHLGWSLYLKINSKDTLDIDLSEISDPQWKTLDELKSEIHQYESWSQLVINSL